MSCDTRPKATIVIEHHGAVIARRVYLLDEMAEEALGTACLFGSKEMQRRYNGSTHKLTLFGEAFIPPPEPRDPLIFGASA